MRQAGSPPPTPKTNEATSFFTPSNLTLNLNTNRSGTYVLYAFFLGWDSLGMQLELAWAFWFLFVFTAAGVVQCGSRKMSPHTSSIVQFVFYFDPLRSVRIFSQGFNNVTVWVDSLWKRSQILYESVTDSLSDGHRFFTVLVTPLQRTENCNCRHILGHVLLEKVSAIYFILITCVWIVFKQTCKIE